jgi:hypothetical protein
MSDALTDITENRRDTARGNHDAHAAVLAGKHRGTVADDDVEGRREPAGHGRHRRALAE